MSKNKNEGIVIELILEAQNFFKNLRDIFLSVKKEAQVNLDFKKVFEDNVRYVELLNKSTLGWLETIRKTSATVEIDLLKTKKIIEDISAKMGISKTQAAMVAAATGQVNLANAQSYLYVAGQKHLMNAQQLNAVLLVQQNLLKGTSTATLSNAQASNAASAATGAFQNQLKNTSAVALSNSQALNSLNDTLKTLSGTKQTAAKASSGFFDGLSKGFRNIAGFLGSLFLFQYALTGLSEFLTEATQKFREFSNANFLLENAIKASQAQMGGAAGSMKEWQAVIDNLSRKYITFSKKDIVEGIASLAKLQPVLNFSTKQMEDLAESAAVLSQISGASFKDVSQDIIQALGGSSVVLDKYSLFIRDVDKSNSDFAKSIGKTTAEMNSQELAAATLSAIMKQLGPLQKNLGDYSQTSAGQVAAANAKIEDSMTKIGEASIKLDILFKNFWANVLDGVVRVIPAFDEFLRKIDEINNTIFEREKAEKNVGLFDPAKFGMNLRMSFGGVGDVFAQIRNDLELGKLTIKEAEDFAIEYFTKVAGLQGLAARKAVDEFVKAYTEYRRKINETLKEGFKPPERSDPMGIPGVPKADESELDEKSKNISEKYFQKVIDATIDFNRDMDKLEKDRINDFEKNQINLSRDLEDAARKYSNDLARIERDAFDDRNKARIKLERGLEDIEDEFREDREKKEREYQDKTLEAWRDYYRALEELNMRHIFDLRDAVAENDAVAVKRLERRYTLEKLKIDNNLEDKLEDIRENHEREIEELRRNTEDRKAELEKRYQRELEDIKRNMEIQNREASIKYEEQLNTIRISNQRAIDDLNRRYTRERELLIQNHQQKLEDIGKNLKRESDLNEAHLKTIFKQMETYLGKGGEFLKLVNGYYDELLRIKTNRQNDISIFDPDFQAWLKGFGIEIPPGFRPPPASPTPTPPRPTPNPRPTPGPRPASLPSFEMETSKFITVQFTSDGTIPDDFYRIVAERTITDINRALKNVMTRML